MLIAALAGSPRFYDEIDYDHIARHLLAGEGFSGDHGPTAFRAPGQALFLAAVYLLTGPEPLAAAVVQALLLAVVPFAVARLAWLASGERRISGAVAALAALHPALAYASATLYPVALSTALLAVGAWLAAEAVVGGRRRHALGAGLSFAFLGVTTPYFAPLPVLAALALFSRRRLALGALIASVGLLGPGAWVARNAATMGAATLGTHGGYNLALGANDEATPRSGNWVTPALARAEVPDDEVARDAAYRAAAVRWIGEHPARWAALSVARAACVLDSVGRPRTEGAHVSLSARLVGWALAPLVVLGVLGLVMVRRPGLVVLLAAPFALVVLASATSIVKPRFRFPCDPLLFAAAAAPLARAAGRLRPRAHHPDQTLLKTRGGSVPPASATSRHGHRAIRTAM